MSRFEKLSSVYHFFFRRHVCLSNLKHAPSLELPLTARKTVFSHLNVKDAVPEGLRTRVVYKFSCARRIVMLVILVKPADVSPQEFAGTSVRSSNVFRHLQSSESCRTSCTPDCFQILDSAATKYLIYVHKIGEIRPQPANETHNPGSLPVSVTNSAKLFGTLYCQRNVTNLKNM